MMLIINVPDDQAATLKAKAASAGFAELAAAEAESRNGEQVAKSIVHLQESDTKNGPAKFGLGPTDTILICRFSPIARRGGKAYITIRPSYFRAYRSMKQIILL